MMSEIIDKMLKELIDEHCDEFVGDFFNKLLLNKMIDNEKISIILNSECGIFIKKKQVLKKNEK